MRAGRREKRLLNAKRALQKAVALSGEGAVTGKLRRRDRGPDVIKFIARRERPIERNADHGELRFLTDQQKRSSCRERHAVCDH